jgi:hypothetical protein
MRHQAANTIFDISIYPQAFQSTLLMATENSCKKGGQIAFVHDEGEDYDQLRQIYAAFKEMNPKSGAKMKGFLPLSDKDVPGLQIADMFANSIMNRTNRHMQYGDANVQEILMYSRSKLYMWDQRFGEAVLAANMRSRQIPLPDSLAHTQEVLDKLGL